MQDARKEERERLGEEAPPKLVPKTIDSMREKDVTTVGGETGRVFTDKNVLVVYCFLLRLYLCHWQSLLFILERNPYSSREYGWKNNLVHPPDIMIIGVVVLGEEADEEVEHDVNNDEFSSYFEKSYQPKEYILKNNNTPAYFKEAPVFSGTDYWQLLFIAQFILEQLMQPKM